MSQEEIIRTFDKKIHAYRKLEELLGYENMSIVDELIESEKIISCYSPNDKQKVNVLRRH